MLRWKAVPTTLSFLSLFLSPRSLCSSHTDFLELLESAREVPTSVLRLGRLQPTSVLLSPIPTTWTPLPPNVHTVHTHSWNLCSPSTFSVRPPQATQFKTASWALSTPAWVYYIPFPCLAFTHSSFPCECAVHLITLFLLISLTRMQSWGHGFFFFFYFDLCCIQSTWTVPAWKVGIRWMFVEWKDEFRKVILCGKLCSQTKKQTNKQENSSEVKMFILAVWIYKSLNGFDSPRAVSFLYLIQYHCYYTIATLGQDFVIFFRV